MVINGIWAMFDHSAPVPFAHLSFNLGQLEICRIVNLVRRWTVAIYIKFSQQIRSRFWREERLPNHSGRASILSNLCMHRVLSAVKRWISSGRDLSLSHPYKNSFLRDACKCWMEMELRLGKATDLQILQAGESPNHLCTYVLNVSMSKCWYTSEIFTHS